MLTELPVKPIRFALSIAERTLFMAPAAANLALSVIDRACIMDRSADVDVLCAASNTL